MNAAPKGLRAALYARVSTEEQVDGTSLAEQIRLCTAEIERHGWTLDPDHRFIDAGISGTDRTRPAWQKLLAAARTGEVEAVVVLKLDRFARNAGAIITETDRFIESGVRFVVVDQGLDLSTPAGRMMRTMLAGVAEMERDLIVGRTVAGQRAKGHNGTWPGGQPPFGWRLEGHKRDARPVPDEREREVLAQAHRLLVTRRLNPFQVADLLNDAGLHPRIVPRWNPEALRRILANDTLHTGKITWGAPESGAAYKRSHKTKLDRHGKPIYGDPIELTLPEPPLTQAQHRSIMRALAKRSTRGAASDPVSRMLTTRLFGECGMPYIGVTIKGKDYDVYRCQGRKHLRGAEKCTRKQVNAQRIEARVWAEVVDLLSDPGRLEAMARAYLELPDDDSGGDTAAAITGLDAKILKLSMAQANAARELLLADNPDAIRGALAGIERELAQLKDRRAAYEALVASTADRAERLRDIVALAERARGRLDTLPDAARREICEILQVEVVMGGEVRHSEPEHLTVTGVVDPRLFGDEGGTRPSDAGPRGGSSPSGVTPRILDNPDDRGYGVLGGRGAGLVAEQLGRAATGEGWKGHSYSLLGGGFRAHLCLTATTTSR